MRNKTQLFSYPGPGFRVYLCLCSTETKLASKQVLHGGLSCRLYGVLKEFRIHLLGRENAVHRLIIYIYFFLLYPTCYLMCCAKRLCTEWWQTCLLRYKLVFR